MKKSNCCKAPIIDETDVCSKCGEHCNGLTDWYDVIQEERERQIGLGYTSEHDDEHTDYFISQHAGGYAKYAMGNKAHLVKAAAMIIAELERLERAENV